MVPHKKAKPLKTEAKEAANQPPPAGLRQRKRQQTRERVAVVAIRLFLERGFEATTLDDIAAAAEISRRTFFYYFASKEEVVFAWQDGFSAALAEAIAAAPANLPLIDVAENAVIGLAGQFANRAAVALARLIRDTPALRDRDHVKYERLERALDEALRRRFPGKQNALRVRMAAMTSIGALRIAAEPWLADGGKKNPQDYVRRAFIALRADPEEATALSGRKLPSRR